MQHYFLRSICFWLLMQGAVVKRPWVVDLDVGSGYVDLDVRARYMELNVS